MLEIIPVRDLVLVDKTSREGVFRYEVGFGYNPLFTEKTKPNVFLDSYVWKACLSKLKTTPMQRNHIIHILNVLGGWELYLRILEITDEGEITFAVVDYVNYKSNLALLKGKKAPAKEKKEKPLKEEKSKKAQKKKKKEEVIEKEAEPKPVEKEKKKEENEALI